MRISHRELADCEQNPRRWLAQKSAPEAGRRRGYNQLVTEAIYRLHKSADAPQERRRLTREIVKGKLVDAKRIREALRAFDAYAAWLAGERLNTIECRVNLELPVTSLVTLGGQISRVDLIDSGYAAVLLGPYDAKWSTELRMPLIQVALSGRYGRAPSEFSVGVQRLDGTQLETRSFSARERDAALQRLTKLADRLETFQKQASADTSTGR